MSWMIFPDNPALSALALFLIAIPFLYAARRPMHGLIRSAARTLSSALRLGARWLMLSAAELRSRNRVVLLARGREEITQAIEREFERVTAIVSRDLHGYPALQRKLMDEITRIEEDYKKCGEVPPPPPEWTKAVATIAKLKDGGDGLVSKILEDISRSIERIYDRVVGEYRRAYEDRHRILKGFLPFWRSVEQTLTRVDRNLTGLQEAAARIDVLMDKYQEIAAGSEKAEQSLTASATTQFVISSLVLAIAFGGAFVNFWLIARPMSAMVGGGQYIVGNFEAAHIAALVIILLETTAGLFLMESLRITHLFPRIHSMPDERRHLLLGASLVFLVILAGVEVALAVMRDQIIAADIALKQGLSGEAAAAAAAAAELGWVAKIPVAGQMVLGAVLPFLLAFVALPFEYFIHSARTVLGALLVLAIRAFAFLLRIAAHFVRQLGVFLAMFYDVVVFIPLAIERWIGAMRSGRPGVAEKGAVAVKPFAGDTGSFRKTG
jgi:hypothetical protein